MKLVWHIFKKDARLMRGPLAAWVGMQLALFAIAGLISFPVSLDAGPGWEDWVGGAHLLVTAIMGMSTYFFAALPIHEDAVAGFDALWLTRPVSRLQLLAAKLLGLAVFFCAVSVLVRLPWWLAHGFGAREVGLAAIETVQTTAAIVALSFALASATSNAGQFYRWTLGAAVAVVAAIFLLLATRPGNAVVIQLFGHPASWSATAAVLTVPFILIAASQFLRPNSVRTALLMAALVLTGTFFGTIPVAPYAPVMKADLQAMLSELAGTTGKIRIIPKSGTAPTFVTLKQAELYSGTKRVGGVFVAGEVNSLIDAIGSFSRLPQAQNPTVIYELFAAGQNGRIEPKEAWLDAQGAIWQVEYVLNAPLVEGGQFATGSRHLRIERLVPGRADGATPAERGGQLVLHEAMPVLMTEEKFRPEFLSEFYLLVTPAQQKRIMPFSVSTLVSANVGARSSFFPFPPQEFWPVAGQSAPRAGQARLLKVGLRRLGIFHEKIPVTLTGTNP